MLRCSLVGNKGCHVQRGPVTPFTSHQQDGVLMELGPDQGVHLGHVTAQPEQPASDCRQDQHALDDAEREEWPEQGGQQVIYDSVTRKSTPSVTGSGHGNAYGNYSPPVGSLGRHDRQHDADDTPQHGEDQERKERGTHLEEFTCFLNTSNFHKRWQLTVT